MLMKVEELLEFTAEAGRILLENGAETGRVEDTLRRIIRFFYGSDCDVFVVLTGFFINIGRYSKAVRVTNRTVNLDKVAEINSLSRDIARGSVAFEKAWERLRLISVRKTYPMWIKTLASAMSCGFFTLMQNGGAADALNAFITGIILNISVGKLRRINTPDFIVTFAGGVIIALSVSGMYTLGLGRNVGAMITGAIMPLVPGLGITNALRDIIGGDYLSGGARMFDALVTAVALAGGAGAVMYMLGNLTGGMLL
jgi:uncharacterized membrane protein YjjP (DUF1212 family)